MEIPLKVKKLHPDAQLPFVATPQSIGLDLYALLLTDTGRPNTSIVAPRSSRMIRTGLAVELLAGYAGFVCSRSGLAKNHSIFVTNSPGVIDPDFRGEIFVMLYNGGHESYYVKHQDRIGQLIVLPAPFVRVEEVAELSETVRGESGFGSSGR